MKPIAEGLWVDTHPVSVVGVPLSATMAILDLGGGSLLVWSPVPLTPERRQAVEALGRVRHVYAPNLFHHSWVGDWAKAFPEAKLHAPRALAKKRPDLTITRVHGDAEPEFDGVLDEFRVEGCRLGESALVHRPTKTLIVADLVHNVGPLEGTWAKLYTKTMGFHDRVALSRMLRWTAFSDRRRARKSIDAILEQPFERFVVGHGEAVTKDPKEALRGAYDWLP
jgi:hypothetical protein